MAIFYKYHGAGNDFVMLDGRINKEKLSSDTIAFICHRQLGIGADGLIFVAPKEGYDFEMIYFNSDGSPAQMCGNGARCAAAFAYVLGISGKNPVFLAGDGPHHAEIDQVQHNEWIVKVSMRDVEIPGTYRKQTEINTGTPHFVNIVDDVYKIDVLTEGRKIRYSEKYAEKGVNVDWLDIDSNLLNVRTYERGVENETLSCGTGVTACAIVAALSTGQTSWKVKTPGGLLSVSMKRDNNIMREIVLTGPAKLVFKGEIELP